MVCPGTPRGLVAPPSLHPPIHVHLYSYLCTYTRTLTPQAPAYIRWSTLMQDGTFFSFVGKADDNPKIQIALKELKKNTGTNVIIKLDFLEVPPPAFPPAPASPSLSVHAKRSGITLRVRP